MMKNNKISRKSGDLRRFSSPDAAILLLVICAVVSAVFCILVGEKGIFPEDKKVEGSYTVTFSPKTAGDENFESIFSPGEDIYLNSGEIIGKVTEADGEKATVSASGVMTDSGFMLNGTVYLASNMTLELRSFEKTVTVSVTDISFNK